MLGRVCPARKIQMERFKSAGLTTNAAMGARQVRECCKLDSESRSYVEGAMEADEFLRTRQ